MNQLPEQAPVTVGPPLSNEAAAIEAERIITTAFRDPTPPPAIGTAPPVAQPGRPPMSQGATDASVLMLSGSVLTVAVGGTGSLVMLASGYADPVVIGLMCAAPAALAIPVLAVSRLLKGIKDATPAEHHHHYNGSVHQHSQTVTNHNRLWGKSSTAL